MIIKKEKISPKNNEIRQKVRFAFFPVKMKKSIEDTYGEIIWLEKYVLVEQFHHEPEYTSLHGWRFLRKERLTVAALHVLEK